MQEVEYQFWVREQERKVRSALTRPQFRLKGSIPTFSMAFQPIVDVDRSSIWGYEALVRSTTGEPASTVLSRVPRSNFHLFDKACRSKAIDVAIKSGLLEHPETKLCVNVNPNAAIEDLSNLKLTCDEAVEVGFPLSRLVLELVEDDEITDANELKQMVDDYRSCGVQIAMDDFGAGYSGLKLLSRLQPDIVKLDMGLVNHVDTERHSQIIIRAITQACTELNIVTIAEGVERYEQCKRLQDMGVAYQQGYFFSRPIFETLPQVTFPLEA
jgi:EAL domain-containing protein (putative c-di-GMP-specific phosphodiesterase class I)